MRFCGILAITAISVLGFGSAHAASDSQAIEACRAAIGSAGYQDYHFERLDVAHPRAGGIAVAGQAFSENERVEFTCILTDEAKLVDKAINPLPPRKTTSVSGKGNAISKGNMHAYCKGEASAALSARPARIAISGTVADPDSGGWMVRGSAYKGEPDQMNFVCRYDGKRRFINVQQVGN